MLYLLICQKIILESTIKNNSTEANFIEEIIYEGFGPGGVQF